MENSRIERYFQVFTGEFNDFQQNHGKFKDWQIFKGFTGDFIDFTKNTHNSRIETYFQVFTGDFKDFKRNHGQFKDFKRIFKFSLVTSKDWRVFSSVRWWL
jgi:ribosomal protein S17E